MAPQVRPGFDRKAHRADGLGRKTAAGLRSRKDGEAGLAALRWRVARAGPQAQAERRPGGVEQEKDQGLVLWH